MLDLLAAAAAPASDWRLVVGRTHLLLLHFPIALLIAAALMEVTVGTVARRRGRRLARREDAERAARRLGYKPSAFGLGACVIGAAGAGLAAFTGWSYAEEIGVSDAHRWTGVATAGAALLAAAVGILAAAVATRPALNGYLVLLVLAGTGAGVAGHLGGDMVHGKWYVLSPLLDNDPPIAATPPDEHQNQAAATPPLNPPPGGDATTPADRGSLNGTAHAGTDEFLPVAQIIETRCIGCHGPRRQRGQLRLDGYLNIVSSGTVTPGDPDASELLRRMLLPDDDRHRMPPLPRDRVPETETETIRAWILAGAPEPPAPAAADTRPDSTGPRLDLSDSPAPEAVSTAMPSGLDPALLEQAADAAARLRTLGAVAERLTPEHEGYRVAVPTPPEDGSGITPRQIVEALAGLEPVLVELDLGSLAITDDDAALLEGFDQIRTLNLRESAITDAGVKTLAPLPRLRTLNLYGTRITDAALNTLRGAPTLRVLYCWNTGATPTGAANLRASNPDVTVVLSENTPWP